jgi:CubicO group peptidase (beta-lactamase class C family)
MKSLSARLACCACVLSLVALAVPGADKAPPPTPAMLRARAIANLTPSFKTYVFSGTEFPACSVNEPGGLSAPPGPLTQRTTFYNRAFHPVTAAEQPGMYGAVVEITPKDGRSFRRFVTLYRTAEKVPDGQRFAADSLAELARALGIDGAVIRRQETLVLEVLKERPFSEWSHDPRAARLLAGLTQSAGGSEPIHKYDDAFAQDRQWWVGLERRLYGWDKLYPHPFIGPRPKEGQPARVVREGSAAEAGMKPDAAANIDKVLREFAADTDQAFAVCIVRHGVIVLHRAHGTRDGKPMTVDTPSWMASVTKTMSASLMAMLIDQGLVGLDDPVDKYLPPLRNIPVKKPLTIHHLYTHTNGLTLDGWPGWNDEMPDVPERLAAYYDQLRVGAEWAYTGTGNILGGKIIEAVSGEAVPQFYHEHLLGPLGCTHTAVVGTHADAFSTPLDVAKFGQMLLNRGAYGKLRFFREETFEKMLPQKLTKLLGPGARSFGFGLDGTPRKFGHGAASAATFSVDVDKDLVVIVTRNRQGKNQDRYNGRFWQAIENGLLKE